MDGHLQPFAQDPRHRYVAPLGWQVGQEAGYPGLEIHPSRTADANRGGALADVPAQFKDALSDLVEHRLPTLIAAALEVPPRDQAVLARRRVDGSQRQPDVGTAEIDRAVEQAPGVLSRPRTFRGHRSTSRLSQRETARPAKWTRRISKALVLVDGYRAPPAAGVAAAEAPSVSVICSSPRSSE